VRRAPFAIRRITDLGGEVKEFDLVPVEPGRRPWSHAPGAHVFVETPVRTGAYSLTGDGVRPESYRISVRRVGDAGGSAWLHDRAEVGSTVHVSAPMSAFAPVAAARHHLLVAAGIGVTPILSHARAARRWGRTVGVVYGHADGRAPHRDELAALAGRAFTEAVGRAELSAVLAEQLRRQPVGTHAYACGPPMMLERFAALAAECGWPDERVHVERFAALDLGPGAPFILRVSGWDIAVEVPAGVTALQALDSIDVRVPRLCERGVCGQCRTRLVAGVPEHRDLILSRSERAANDCFFPCVSRAVTADLEVAAP
jgi:ferredoxin-NADP reductase